MAAGPQRGRLVVLVHWNAEEWSSMAAPLRRDGWQVSPHQTAKGLKQKDPASMRPAAVVISLRRLPSHGRKVASAIWYPKWARQAIRIVFVDGAPDVVAKVRSEFPSAAFCSYEQLPSLLGDLQ